MAVKLICNQPLQTYYDWIFMRLLKPIDALANAWLTYRTKRVNYQDYIHSPAWRYKATAAKKRALWACQVCNSAERLETHHRTYVRLGREWDSDLTVLCRECHQLYHGKVET